VTTVPGYEIDTWCADARFSDVSSEAAPVRDRVLVVDDEETFAGMIAEILRDKGFDATFCTHPDQALNAATDGSYAAVVVDLLMPVMTGVELAGRIKAASPDTQVIMLTGHGDMESAIAGIQYGISDYLQKAAIDIPRLTRAVSAATHRCRLLRENRELLQQLRETNRQLASLHDTTSRISAEPHLDRLLLELVTSAKSLCDAAAGRAILFDHATPERFVVEQAIGDDTSTLAGVRLSAGEGIAVGAVEQGAAVLSLLPRKDPRFSDRIDVLSTELPGLVCAPLRHGRVRGVLMVAGRRRGAFTTADRDVLAILARHAAVAVDNAIEHERGVNFFTHTSDLLVSLLDRVDSHYEGHSRASAHYADMMTRRLGLADVERRDVHFAALLHDMGKLLIPPEVLQSTTYQNDAERELLRRHPMLAVELLKPIAAWEEILPMIHAHHERWDGTGYPLGIAGEGIPLGARIIAVAEAFDAMTRRRAHGPARTTEEALVELEAFAGTQFDPKIVRLFVAEYRQTAAE
jgi:response regulator RpfG family c-di-GMP phosphodiesterase